MDLKQLREQVKNANDVKIKPYKSPAWSCTVYARTMTGTDKDAFEASNMTGTGKAARFNFANYRARLVRYTMCDEHGTLMWTDADIPMLAGKSAAELDGFIEVAKALNAITAADIEEIAKN